MASAARKGSLVLAGLAILALVAACGAKAPTPTPTRVPTSTPRPATATPSVGAQTPTAAPTGGDPVKGKALYSSRGCSTCHGANGEGQPGVGARLVGIYGAKETLTDGSQVTVDDAYVTESIRTPNAKVVKGFSPIMPPFALSDSELKDIIAYIASLK